MSYYLAVVLYSIKKSALKIVVGKLAGIIAFMRHSIFLAATLACLWLLNSGHYNGLLLSLGALSIVFVVWIANKMDVVDNEAQPLHLTVKLPVYILWLLKEIVYSNIAVVKCVWQGVSSIDPDVRTFKVTQKDDMARVVYANSITLTPGTVTLDLNDDEVVVHALHKDSLDELEKGDMDTRVSRLED